MRRRTVIGLAAFCFACVLASPASADEWNKTWTVGEGAQLSVKADDGNIRVEAGSASQIRATVRTTGWSIGDQEVRVTERQAGNVVELELKVPSTTGFSFNFHRQISIELTVPRDTVVNLHTGDGNIEARGTEGPLRADTGDGNITADRAKGTLEFRTGDGNIDVEDLEGSVAASTGDGNLAITGRFDTVAARTGDGNIEITAERGTRIGSAWSIRTGDGDITLHLPDGVAADLDATTGDGHVTCDFEVKVSGKVEENKVRGPMNGGGPVLEIHTGDGNIRISRR